MPPEIEKTVQTVQVDRQCDKCQVGLMKYTGTNYPTSPMRYLHKCNTCEDTSSYTLVYPYIKYV